MLFESKKGIAVTNETNEHKSKKLFVFPVLSEIDEINKGIIIAANWHNANNTPQREWE